VLSIVSTHPDLFCVFTGIQIHYETDLPQCQPHSVQLSLSVSLELIRCFFSVKEYRNNYVLLQVCGHTVESHVVSSSILNPKQKGAFERAARSAPLALGSQIHTSTQFFSPCRHIPYDKSSRKAVARLTPPTYPSSPGSPPGRLQHHSRLNLRSSARSELPVVALRPSWRHPARAKKPKGT
jgi:hypothetical protein